MSDIYSNYDKMKHSMTTVFLQYNQEKMIQKFALEADQNYLYLDFIRRKYRIARNSGIIQWSDNHFQTANEADYNEVMTIYDVLCYSKENCHLAHEFVNINSLSSIKGGNLSPSDNFFQNQSSFFDGKVSQLDTACRTLFGKKLEKGDVAYQLDLFSFLPVIIRFWESDDEFPATLQILVDKNTLDYMHYETLMFALTHLFYRLKENL